MLYHKLGGVSATSTLHIRAYNSLEKHPSSYIHSRERNTHARRVCEKILFIEKIRKMAESHN